MLRVPIAVVVLSCHLLAQCAPDFDDGFGVASFDDPARAFAWFDDGTGPSLYAGGAFSTWFGLPTPGIARWTGNRWVAVGGGVDGPVWALRVVGPPSNQVLAVGGTFTTAGGVPASNLAFWDGSSWSSPTGGGCDGPVLALETIGSSLAPRLVVGGAFLNAGGIPASRIATYGLTTGTWSTWGAGVTQGDVRCLAAQTIGLQETVFVGGTFLTAGGLPASRVARNINGAWFQADPAFFTGLVNDLIFFDDGTGPTVYAASDGLVLGLFAPSNPVFRWDGVTWSPFGPACCIGASPFMPPRAFSLAVRFGPNGTRLLAAQNGLLPSGFSPVIEYDGANWQPVGTTPIFVDRVFTYRDGPFDSLLINTALPMVVSAPAASTFINVPSRFDGNMWEPLTQPTAGPLNARSTCFATWDDGLSGSSLYIGGAFTTAGIFSAPVVARYSRPGWEPLPGAPFGITEKLVGWEGGPNPGLYAAGAFGATPTALPDHSFARWDGVAWTPIPLPGNQMPNAFMDMVVYDDGQGEQIYISALFTTGATLRYELWRFDGVSFQVIPGPINIESLTILDDGQGPRPALFALANGFPNANGIPSRGIIRYDGISLTPVALDLSSSAIFPSPIPGRLRGSLENGTPVFFVHAPLAFAPGLSFDGLFRYDGAWSGILPTHPFSDINDIAIFDDGTGTQLYAAGVFVGNSGPALAGIARYDGSTWSPLGTGLLVDPFNAGEGRSLLPFDDGTGPGLFVAGEFAAANGHPSFNVARWKAPSPSLILTQPGGAGAGIQVEQERLCPGADYLTLVSFVPCPFLGGGPVAGLCFPDPAILAAQIAWPPNTLPFRLTPSVPAVTHGPYVLPAGTVLQATTLDVTGGRIRARSSVVEITVQ